MSDGAQLLLIVLLVYLSGCLRWIDRRTIMFVSWTRWRWKAVVADYRWGNSSGRVYLLNPFPPLGFPLASRLLPVSISPDSIVAYNVQTVGNSGRPPQSKRMVAITPAAKFARKDSVLTVDGKTFCDIGDVETAHRLAVLLNRMKNLDEAARERAICEFWKERLNLRNAKKGIRLAIAASRGVRIFCSIAFAAIFVAIPLWSNQSNVGLAVLLGAGIFLLTALAVCRKFVSLHRRHYPVFKESLREDLAKMLLCPPTALRASDLIVEKLSAHLDALPLAVLLLRGAERDEFLAGYIADLESPNFPDTIPDAIRSACLWQNQTILQTAASLMPSLKRFMRNEPNAGADPAATPCNIAEADSRRTSV